MARIFALIQGTLAILLLLSFAKVASPQAGSATDFRQEEVVSAIDRALPLVQRAAANYPQHRQCFSCHHQTLPILAMVTARGAGFHIDEELLKSQAAFTMASFGRQEDRLRDGGDVGGGAMTVGYGLWTLDLVGQPRNSTTDAMVQNLLLRQKEEGNWGLQAHRPPLEESMVTSTVLASRFLARYAPEASLGDVNVARSRAMDWLRQAELKSQEDLNSWASGLALLGADRSALALASERVLQAQNTNGGWAQEPGMQPDAYATGQTLFVLLRMRISPDLPAIRRGVRFLLDTQLDDGSWFVETRSKPIQVYFDNGDPHGKSQFISTSATCWAVTALSLVRDAEAKHIEGEPAPSQSPPAAPPS